ncbi:Uncharacterised protein [Vibrio cholerae]|nr:Uncharacterised protein [Vibrio cholerae]CSI13082.1 Uncharacterised protein [Vibrio cholerae]CSI59944.1 Uncharacterised protein [Vibrio cholerae]
MKEQPRVQGDVTTKKGKSVDVTIADHKKGERRFDIVGAGD